MLQLQRTSRSYWTIGVALSVAVVVLLGLWGWQGGTLGKTLLARIPFFRGTLEIRLKDHREAIGDFARLEVIIKTIRLSPQLAKPNGKSEWMELSPTVKRVDLTRYVDNNSAVIFQGPLPPGAFEAIHLKLDPIGGILKRTRQQVPVADSTRPIKLPFSIRPRAQTRIVLDLVVMDISDHLPRGYELHIKGYELYTEGRLIAKIPPF